MVILKALIVVAVLAVFVIFFLPGILAALGFAVGWLIAVVLQTLILYVLHLILNAVGFPIFQP